MLGKENMHRVKSAKQQVSGLKRSTDHTQADRNPKEASVVIQLQNLKHLASLLHRSSVS